MDDTHDSDDDLGGNDVGKNWIGLGDAAAGVLARLAERRRHAGRHAPPVGVIVTPASAPVGDMAEAGVFTARGRAANG